MQELDEWLKDTWSRDLLTQQKGARLDYGYGVGLGGLEYFDRDTAMYARNNLQIRQWTRQSELITPDEQHKWFHETIRNDTSIKMYAIHKPADGQNRTFSGVCGLTSISKIHRSAEFSLYIIPGRQKMGLGKAALKTLVRHGFEDLNLHSIWGESFTGNPAMKMFEQIGFKKDGIRRQCYYKLGKYTDAHMYSLLKAEWSL